MKHWPSLLLIIGLFFAQASPVAAYGEMLQLSQASQAATDQREPSIVRNPLLVGLHEVGIEVKQSDTSSLSLLVSPDKQGAIAAGTYHTCALTSSGGVKCWGYNGNGQLGDNTTIQRLTPLDVSGLSTGVVAITAGGSHTCALTSSGGVKCWGDNSYGQLGDNTTTQRLTPVEVSGLSSGVVAITAGGSHTCAVTSSGGVKCWGDNSYGQLGDNTTTRRLSPVAVSGLSTGVVAITAGGSHTCALTSSGGIKCWGYNGYGQLGDNTTTRRSLPVEVSGLSSGVIAITAGETYTCALTSNGGVKCWGFNVYGQLGDNTTTQRLTPVDVSGLSSGVVRITTGRNHTCALTSSGGVKCWGDNYSGQLGDNTTTQQSSPVEVSGLSSGVTAIEAGVYFTCALTSSGGVKCWGDNSYGQLGDDTIHRLVPVDVKGLSSGVVEIMTGGRHSCALTSSGGVKCWGSNSFGQLGDNTTTQRSSPVDVSGLSSGVSAISAGGTYTCALTNGGGVKCWGDNRNGQLGDNTTTQQSLPVDVNGLSGGVSAISTGGSHTCALIGNGGIKCWGNNSNGQLGDNTTAQRLTPVDVNGLSSGVIAIAAGKNHTCALTSSGGIKCWGLNNYGQLGDNTITRRLTPVDVSGLNSGVLAITAGGDYTCALTNSGEVKCWGNNIWGQLGDDTIDQRLTPVDVSGLNSGVIAISAGINFYMYTNHTCALTRAGGVKCWGDNNFGQLGDNTTVQRLTPVDVNGLSSEVMAIAAGESHTCAVTSSGGGKCWGYNSSGQIGDGTSMIILSPMDVPNISGWRPTPQLTWNAEGDQASASLGWSVSSAGDIKGDGHKGVVVGLPHYGTGGAVFVYYGTQTGIGSSPDLVIMGDEASALFGWSAALAGDVNHDGFGDIIVGATGCSRPEKNEGCAYVYLGSASGLSSTPAWTMQGNQSGAAFGYAVGTVGDVNGDTFGDIFVTGPNYSHGQNNEGAVYVYHGSASGPSVTPDWTGEGNQDNAFFGLSAGSAGDVNGDGKVDLIVGAPNASTDQDQEGKAFVFLGSSTGLGQTAAWVAEGNQVNAHFGAAVNSAGDLNGDNIADIVIGAPDYDLGETDTGSVFVFLGSASGVNSQVGWSGSNHQAGARYGITVASVGDVDLDGFDDLLIGSNRFTNGQENEGSIYLYYGSSAGVNPERNWLQEGNQAYANFGYAFAPLGDVNGDGIDDFIVGAPMWEHDQVDEGRVNLYYGVK